MGIIFEEFEGGHSKNLSFFRILLGRLEEALSEKHSSRPVVQC